MVLWNTLKDYRNGHKQSNHKTGQHSQCCLFVVLACEQSWVLQSSQRTNDGELGATQDGIGFEVAHFQLAMPEVQRYCPRSGRIWIYIKRALKPSARHTCTQPTASEPMTCMWGESHQLHLLYRTENPTARPLHYKWYWCVYIRMGYRTTCTRPFESRDLTYTHVSSNATSFRVDVGHMVPRRWERTPLHQRKTPDRPSNHTTLSRTRTRTSRCDNSSPSIPTPARSPHSTVFCSRSCCPRVKAPASKGRTATTHWYNSDDRQG